MNERKLYNKTATPSNALHLGGGSGCACCPLNLTLHVGCTALAPGGKEIMDIAWDSQSNNELGLLPREWFKQKT